MGIFRKSVLSIATATALATGNVYALGLGEIDVKSGLNQPFNAEIAIVSAARSELDEMRISLAPVEAFTTAGIDRPQFLSGLRFNLGQNDSGKPVIRVTSKKAVREPFLDFLMELSWRNGKILREYTVLIDPPLTMQAPAPAVIAAPVAVTSNTAVPAGISVATRPPASSVSQAAAPTPQTYGPTRRNDTLWQIAKDIKPAEIHVDQMMIALLEANPQAFSSDNINTLKSGYTLQVPAVDEISQSKSQASQAVSEQYRSWKAARAEAKHSVAKNSGSIERSDSTSVSNDTPAPSASLQLVAPDDVNMSPASAGSSSSTSSSSDVSGLKKELVLANETLEAQRLESVDMSKRLSLLEEQIQNMQRLIQLRDDELASLQARAGNTAEEAAEIPVVADIQNQAEAVADSMESEPVPVVADTEKSADPTFVNQMLSSITDNPALLAGGGAALLSLLGFAVWRRRQQDDYVEYQESILRSPDEGMEDAPQGDVMDSDITGTVGGDTSLLSEFAVSNISGGSLGDEADPLAEADVFLAYGRYQQAEDLLQSALQETPDDEDLNLKLLEIYQASDDSDGFDKHAQSILDQLGNNRQAPLWLKVADMGLTLSPGHPLYIVDDESDDMTQNSVAPAELTDNTLDFVPPVGGADFQTESDAVDVAVEDEPVANNNDAMDFDLDGLDFSASDDMGDGELADADEVATKLDLARAYIDMGDPEGAKSILDEVVVEGSNVQKGEAEEILGKLAS
ncbi:MAG: FimV/HubP family polar landmark protein [Gammaproteobacteria bacterium]